MENKYKQIYYLLITFSLLIVGAVRAQQDNHLSQFQASPMLLNPAYTGMIEDNYRIHTQYRNQWKNLTTNSFVTNYLGFDMPRRKFGYGMYVLNNKAGVGQLKALSVLLSGAYEVTTKNLGEEHHLTTGLQLGIIHKSINLANLTYDNQYTTANGGGFDPSIQHYESFPNTSIVMPDVNFGIAYNNTSSDKRAQPFAGVSGFHLTQPVETFLGQKKKLPMRYQFSGGARIQLSTDFNLEPTLLVMRQTNVNEINIGANGKYFLAGSNSYFMLGTYYRHKDAVIVHTGFIYKDYVFRLSYDINVSSLRAYSNRRGGFELSVTYTKKRSEFIPSIF